MLRRVTNERWGVRAKTTLALKASCNTRVHFGVFNVPTMNISGRVCFNDPPIPTSKIHNSFDKSPKPVNQIGLHAASSCL